MNVIEIAAIITAVGVIAGAVLKIHSILDRIERKFDGYDDTIKENTINILKMSLLSEDLPITDRINAGKRYLEVTKVNILTLKR